MKRLVHNISVRVFEKDNDQLNSTKNLFYKLLPVDFEKEKISVEHEKAEGFNDKTIHILSMDTSKRRNNRVLLDNIFENLSSEEKQKIKEDRTTRLDSEGNFYIRLDKNSLLKNEYKLTDGGDCFHFTVKLAAYPMKKEKILESLDMLLKDKK
mgnify:CR=1 FL=1